MEKEIELLSRVAANHLFLGQFEALRASLLSLRKRRPELALAILRRIVSLGGRIDGVLWSSTLSTPSHLAWLSALELREFENSASIWSFDPELLLLKVEFLLLVQLVSCRASEALQSRSLDLDGVDGKEEVSQREINSIRILNQVLDFGLCRLRSDVVDDAELLDDFPSVNENELKCLWKIFLNHADVFDTLCWNIQRQVHLSEPNGSQLAITVRNDAKDSLDSSLEESETLARIQHNVQLAHLDALKESLKTDGVDEAVSHLRFLHQDYGVDETVYKMAFQDLIKMGWSQITSYGETWKDLRNKMTLMYAEALSSNCIQVVQMIQVKEIFVIGHTVAEFNFLQYLFVVWWCKCSTLSCY